MPAERVEPLGTAMMSVEASWLWRERVQQEQRGSLRASSVLPAQARTFLGREARLRNELQMALMNSPRVVKPTRVVRRQSPRRSPRQSPRQSPRGAEESNLRARPVLPPLEPASAGVASPRVERGAQISYAGIRCFTGAQIQERGIRYKNETSGMWG